MNLYLIGIILSALIGIRLFFKDFNKEYLSRENTTCIKGIFILIVFYSHLCTYMAYQPEKDGIMMFVRNFLGQLMVTMFLFYSGYGVYESIKNKKKIYVNSIPKKRFLKTLINFDIAVLTFAIINYIMGVDYGLKENLLALTGWGCIGNSNWYIFAILCLYITTYVSFNIFEKDYKKALVLNWILTIISMIGISVYRGPGYSYCYNTLICYPLGMTYSYYKDEINKLMFNNKKYVLTLLTVLISFIIFRKTDQTNVINYSLLSISFVILTLLATMKINLKSPILKWCGDNLFWLYILQRIPMMILKRIGYVTGNAYRYALICFVATIILSVIYNKLTKLLHEKILKI